ncbi:MAG: prolipoprotein diacylglyceryl transferase [Deferribacteraceae bacterium]|jgi:phosphatidylglycerol:prolipoprotein diacylglycerol transferase|nr:prolipoprotein diacylglyceryl transferase [Deferribacteraceae bacterium]
MHPYLLKIGSFELRIYSLMIIAAVFIALHFASKRAQAIGLQPRLIENGMIITFICGVLGARLYYVVFNWSYFGSNPSEILAVWHGGLAIHGGIILGVLAGVIFCRRQKLSVLQIADLLAPFMLLGQGIGRFGNFANGEAHGVPTLIPPSVIFQMKPDFTGFWHNTLNQLNVSANPSALTQLYESIASSAPAQVLYRGKEYLLREYVPWGISFPPKYNSLTYQEFGSMPVHPTFFYEMILNFIGAFVLLRLWRKDENLGTGKVASLYLVFYGLIRGFVTFFRADDLMFGPIRAPHMASLLLIAGGVALYVLMKRRQRKVEPAEAVEYDDDDWIK